MKDKATGKRVVVSVAIVVALAALALMTATRQVSADTFTVTTLDDSGPGSLRQAILDANAAMGADAIDFQEGLTGTITLTTAQLPTITDDLTIGGPGAGVLTVSGNSSFRVFRIASGVTASISGLTIKDGNAGSSVGGGIRNSGTLTITSSTISDNSSADLGGGIYSFRGELTVIDSTVSNNSAGGGGGITNFDGKLTVTNSIISGNSASSGGGIYNLELDFGGELTVINSTFSGNSASRGGGIFNSGTLNITSSTLSDNRASSGGGIYTVGTLTINNSTFSGNSASFYGGGIYNVTRLTIINSTFSGNSAGRLGGGIRNSSQESRFTTVKNSIIANSPSGGDCAVPYYLPSFSVGVNFSTDGTCPSFTAVPSSGVGGLNLGPLQDNGGPTHTHALLGGSVALDAITDCTDVAGNAVTADQRGVSRPQSSACDVGAFEAIPCTITCPANITQPNDANQCGAVVNYTAPTTSGDLDCGTVTCNPPSGSFYSVGVTPVTCTTAAGPSCSFSVTVNDTEPPTIKAVSVNPSILWPPIHKMADVTINYDVTDNCDPASAITSRLGVSSNEPVNGTGDGDIDPDWEIVDAHHVRLRAERSGGGTGRIYTITITSKDSKGNMSSQVVMVSVPHDQR